MDCLYRDVLGLWCVFWNAAGHGARNALLLSRRCCFDAQASFGHAARRPGQAQKIPDAWERARSGVGRVSPTGPGPGANMHMGKLETAGQVRAAADAAPPRGGASGGGGRPRAGRRAPPLGNPAMLPGSATARFVCFVFHFLFLSFLSSLSAVPTKVGV